MILRNIGLDWTGSYSLLRVEGQTQRQLLLPALSSVLNSSGMYTVAIESPVQFLMSLSNVFLVSLVFSS